MIQQKATPFETSPEFIQANQAWNQFMQAHGPDFMGGDGSWPRFVEKLSVIKNDELTTDETKKLRLQELLSEGNNVRLYQTFKSIRQELLNAMRQFKHDSDEYWKGKNPTEVWPAMFDDSLPGAPWNEPTKNGKVIFVGTEPEKKSNIILLPGKEQRPN